MAQQVSTRRAAGLPSLQRERTNAREFGAEGVAQMTASCESSSGGGGHSTCGPTGSHGALI